ncbi:HlyD family secretion protein [Caulobacter sp. S45]|uniref:HlyD family secretion protein n=1 Tax=Caulobacter sp. S45 TaxID=1641861 RepID=UPI00131E546F|nr:HlyD family secretion protein [Caulobacter sp. S45]
MQEHDARHGGKSPRPLKNPAVRIVLLGAAAVVVEAAVVFGAQWWAHGRFVQSTNDAYLRADQVAVAPKVQGYVEKVFVVDNQPVQAGQPLVQIDANTYRAALDQQAATVDARKADIVAADRQIDQQAATVDQRRAQLSGSTATTSYATGEAHRFETLSAQGVETQARAAQAVNQRDQALASQRADTAAVKAAERQIATLKAQAGQSRAQLENATAQLQSAQINLGDAMIRAGISGRVGDKTVQVGQYVQPGTRLMSLVPVKAIYLVANFKETQIGRMRIGQPAKVKIDAFGDRAIDATVESFSPGTGAQFALLPPENATGNFTKIVQRVPVRLRLHPPDDMHDRLLSGLSAAVSVDTSASPQSQTSGRRP